ncbi:MAG: ABC transporter permease [Gemmatimonadetes bacterium]|nr:ABC transporter permease [Gemmatimonadota bacterium]
MSWARRFYRILLRAYPPAFRERYGEDMEEAFAYLLEARGSWRPDLWMGTLWDVTTGGLGERRRAGRQFGMGIGKGGVQMEGWLQDLKYGARTLWKNPGFTAIAVATLALGIGANSAIFSVVDSVLLEDLPYEEPDELVTVWAELQTRSVEFFPYSPPELRDLREQTSALEDLAGVVTFRQPLTGEGDPVQVSTAGVTTNFFDLLGVAPQIGRSFTGEDGVAAAGAAPGAAPPNVPNSIILSHGLWQRRFGSDPGVLGRTVEVGGVSSEIVGVLPPDFQVWLPPEANVDPSPDLWGAMRLDFDNSPRNNVFISVMGRLRDGATVQQAQAELDAVTARFGEQFDIYNTLGYRQRAVPLMADVTRAVRPVILALLGAVIFVLLIACANVANLLIVRASARERELAVRAAMGGDRARLIRQLITESLLIGGLGGLAGLVVAQLGIEALQAFGPATLPRLGGVSLDGTVLLFTVLAATGAALVFGVVPALQGSRVDLSSVLGERGRGGARAGVKRLRSAAVVLEVALSLVLLIGTGLMIRSYRTLAQSDPGYDAASLLTFTTNVPFARYPEAADRGGFALRLLESLEALPGAESVGGVFPLPLSGQPFNGRYGTESALEDERNYRQAGYRATVPGYFEAMRTRLIAGRTLNEADFNDSLPNVVVDDLLAARTWPGESAVGKRLLVRATGPEPVWVDVVGVVDHQRQQSLASDGMETIYFTDRYLGSFGAVTWAIRTTGRPDLLVPQVREAVAAIDPLIPLDDVRAMEDRVHEAGGGTRFALFLIGGFGLLALILAAVGLYGVLSYTVRQRTGEFGVRMAFGAKGGSILRLVLRQGLTLALAGVAIGVPAALLLTGVMESLLVGVSPTDPATFVTTSAVFVAVAAMASLVPGLRAIRVDPVEALREE